MSRSTLDGRLKKRVGPHNMVSSRDEGVLLLLLLRLAKSGINNDVDDVDLKLHVHTLMCLPFFTDEQTYTSVRLARLTDLSAL